jgi:hypothetical protein
MSRVHDRLYLGDLNDANNLQKLRDCVRRLKDADHEYRV